MTYFFIGTTALFILCLFIFALVPSKAAPSKSPRRSTANAAGKGKLMAGSALHGEAEISGVALGNTGFGSLSSTQTEKRRVRAGEMV